MNGNPTTFDIAIIGGGIGGLSLLLGLLRHASTSQIQPHLFESAAAFSEIGAGVGFGPNAVQAMRIVSPALHDAYDQIASDSDFITVNGETKAVWNEMVMGMDGRKETNGLRAGDLLTKVIFEKDALLKKNVHRARFLDEMIGLLPGGTGKGYVTFRKRCVDIDTGLENGRVRVHFADSTSVEVDAVVGCDGVKSRVRQILLTALGDTENISPRFTGKYAYRGLIPMDVAEAALGPIARRSHMHWGYDGHLVLFPVDRGATMNVVAFRTKEDGRWESSEWVVSATVEQVLEDYKAWCEPIRKLLGGLQRPDKWALFEHPPAKSYSDHRGKICLLGDCAHASTPHQGAGAGC
jgi:salicylate hydroxylase